MRPLSNFKARDVEALLHPTTNLLTHRTTGPLVLEKGEGIYVIDTDGKRYIEGLAGLWCTALGYGNEELIEAGARADEPAVVLAPVRRPLARARHRARREDQGNRALPDLEGVLHRLRQRDQRQPDQARLVLQQRPRQAEEEEDHQPRAGAITASPSPRRR